MIGNENKKMTYQKYYFNFHLEEKNCKSELSFSLLSPYFLSCYHMVCVTKFIHPVGICWSIVFFSH